MEIKPQKYRVAAVFRTFFFPFTYPELIDSLKKRGYGVPPSPRPVPTGPRVYVGGHIATKEGCTVDVNIDRKIIASEGNSIERVIKSIEELMDIAKKDFQLNLEEDIDYLELISDIIIESDTNPVENIERFMGDKYSVFNEIMGIETSPYSIKIVPKGFPPASKKWFDITIGPRVTRPDREYYVSIIYRDANIDNVLTFIREVNSKILSLIRKMGGT
jgi:hypothetical protein